MDDEYLKGRAITRLILVFFGSIIFFFLGLGMVLLKEDLRMLVVGFISLSFGGAALLYFLYSILTNPTKLLKQTFRKQKQIDKTKHIKHMANAHEQDIQVAKILFNNPLFIVPHLLVIFLVMVFIFLEFGTLIVSDLVDALFPFERFGVFNLMMYVYILSFVCFSILILGYLSLGEILQRKVLLKAKRIFIVDIIIDYLYAIPFVAILSLLWVIFLFSKDKEKGNVSNTFKKITLYSSFVTFKYYTYINLAIIAIEDSKITYSIKEAFNFFIKERKNLFWIWFKSGTVIVYILAIIGVIIIWNSKYHFIKEGMLWLIFSLVIVLYVISVIISEQVSLLLFYIKTIHNINISNKK